MARPHVTPYASLGLHLAARAAAGETRVTLALGDLEATILRRPLPADARSPRHHRGWWHGWEAHARAGWLDAGWHVEVVDLAAGTVTFARGAG